MAKRFTESDKWRDKWFRALRPEFKLAWLFVLDNCDPAGIIDLDTELADFQIGTAIDWEQFLAHCDGRIERVSKGKYWVVGFIEFQYGTLSGECRAHGPVYASLKRHGLSERVSNRVSDRVLDTLKDKEKDKDKDKDKEKDKDKDKDLGGGCKGEEWIVPHHLDSPAVRELLGQFTAMRRDTLRKPIKDFANTSKLLKHFDSAEHLAYALEFCIANGYQGLKADYRPPAKLSGSSNAHRQTFADLRVAGTQRAIEEFVGDA